jgi:glycosyltransferase involved in cell wall biosynthesis
MWAAFLLHLRSDLLFSLVVCSVDRYDCIERLFKSLDEQACRNFEVILVDQNTDDRLVPFVENYGRRFPILHIRSPKGLSLARNRGIAAATGELIAFPDDDCWYRPETIRIVTDRFATYADLDVITGRTFDAENQPSLSASGESETDITRDNYLACGNSNSIFVRRTTLAEIGGFDERLGVGAKTPFQSGEEADLLLRALASGKRLRYFPDIIVHHDQVDKHVTLALAARAAKYGRGFGALLRKHDYGFVYLLYRLARPLASTALAVLKADWPMARYKWAWLTGIAQGYRRWTSVSRGLPSSTANQPSSASAGAPTMLSYSEK